MLGLWTWGRAVKKVSGGSVTKEGSVSRASREAVLNAQGCCPVKVGDWGIHPTLGGHRREVSSLCSGRDVGKGNRLGVLPSDT